MYDFYIILSNKNIKIILLKKKLIFTKYIKASSGVSSTRIDIPYSISNFDVDGPGSDAAAARLLSRPWFPQADKCKPEEMPPFRNDLPEDKLELLWYYILVVYLFNIILMYFILFRVISLP